MVSSCDGRHSKSISYYYYYYYFLPLSPKFSSQKDIFNHFSWESKRNVEIGVSVLGNIQTQDSFPLDSDCAAANLAKVPT